MNTEPNTPESSVTYRCLKCGELHAVPFDRCTKATPDVEREAIRWAFHHPICMMTEEQYHADYLKSKEGRVDL